MMWLIHAIHFLLVTIFLFALPTKGLVDSCDHCVETINEFCCKRDKSIWKNKKMYCCDFGGATEKPPPDERHRDGYFIRCSKTEALWEMPEREFIIPDRSFCANSCRWPFSPKPYFPKCSYNVMPDVIYLIPQQTGDKRCTVTTRNGKHDQTNKNCIQRVSDFVANHDQSPKIIYIVHGWNEEPGEDWIQPMVDAIRDRDNNKKNAVIGLVSWHRAHEKSGLRNETMREDTTIAGMVCCSNIWPAKGYGQSAANAWPVGNILAYLHEAIIKSVNRMNVKIETHCIGFSLGPHVCGFFGKMIKTRLGYEHALTKIIGLDPARPVFEYQGHSRELALNNGDASSVVIFHTNAGTVGYTGELGDVDLYVNGGYTQPGCTRIVGNQIARWLTAQCHHDYSYKLMTTSLKNDMPCVFQNLDARVRPSSPMKPSHLKSGPICLENKPAFYIGNLTSPANHANKLDGRYEITTDLGRGECTIICKKEHICMHQENSEIMNQLIADCRAG